MFLPWKRTKNTEETNGANGNESATQRIVNVDAGTPPFTKKFSMLSMITNEPVIVGMFS
jgi:hypothetical protein